MLTDLQKEKVQALVKAALETIEGWDPCKKCELVIRAALMVSKSPESEIFRKWAEIGDKSEYLKVSRSLHDSVEMSDDRDTPLARELLLDINAVSAYRQLIEANMSRRHERSYFDGDIACGLQNAKLCAMGRGVKFELIDLIVEMENESRASRRE